MIPQLNKSSSQSQGHCVSALHLQHNLLHHENETSLRSFGIWRLWQRAKASKSITLRHLSYLISTLFYFLMQHPTFSFRRSRCENCNGIFMRKSIIAVTIHENAFIFQLNYVSKNSTQNNILKILQSLKIVRIVRKLHLTMY